ncbi:MAG: 4Fe-4S binding protein [Saprospiraceae bacterium]
MKVSAPNQSAGNSPQDGLNDLVALEMSVCNGVLLPDGFVAPKADRNAFGRPVELISSRGIGQCLGMAAAGQRVAIFLRQPGDLPEPDRRLIADRQLPLVVHAPAMLPGMEDWIVFQAMDDLDARRLTFLAHAIAEQTLTPVLVIADPNVHREEARVNMNELCAWLGMPDEIIPSPDPAQEIVYGPRRRRIPNQFSFDQPVTRYASASWRDGVRSSLARSVFRHRDLGRQIAEAESALNLILPGHSGGVHILGREQASELLLAQAYDARQAYASSHSGKQTACISLRYLQPFPQQDWEEATRKASVIGSLLPIDQVAAGWMAPLQELLSGKALPDRPGVRWIQAVYASPLAPAALDALQEQMRSRQQGPSTVYLDLSLLPIASGSGQKEVLRDTLTRYFPGLNDGLLSTRTGAHPVTPGSGRTPLSLSALVREQADQGPPFSRLARFYHEVILKEDTGVIDTDPFYMQGVIPPLSELLRPQEEPWKGIAVMDPGLCTGCGSCMVQCPYGAMPSLAIGLESLIRSGMTEWTRRGGSTSSLTPLIKNLVTFWSAKLETGEADPMGKGEEALTELLDQMGMDAQKRVTTLQDWSALREMLQELPWAVTDLYFATREQQRSGSGELFTMAIDPHACTSCGRCVDVCPVDALTLSADEPALVRSIQAYALWEALPDTPGETIHAMHLHPEVTPLSALMLSRHHYQSMVGGPEDPEVAPARMILHSLTALLEAQGQPIWQSILSDLAALRQGLDTLALDQFQQALPDRMSPDLERVIDEAGDRKLALDDLLARLPSEGPGKRVDTAQLSQWIHTSRELAMLEEALKKGTTGGGRSRYGIMLSGEWGDRLVQFPYQPFQVPVWVESSLDLDRVQGVLLAQQQWVLGQVRLLRLADLQIKQNYRPEIHDTALQAITWADLTREEKRLLPPLVVVTTAREWADLPSHKASRLLSGDMPVKVVVIQDQLPAPEDTYARQGWLLPWLTAGQLPVVQTSPCRMAHFATALQSCLASPGPALVSVLGYSGQDTRWLQHAEELLVAGLFPLIMAVPQGDHALLSDHLHLEAVPEPGIPVDSLLSDHVRSVWSRGTSTTADWSAVLNREWTTWLELAGRIRSGQTDETRQIRQELTAALTERQQSLEADYQRQLADLKASFREEVRVQLADRLYHLSRSRQERPDAFTSAEKKETTS